MWVYEQTNGWLGREGKRVARGYSGHPPYVNEPAAQAIRHLGPIPQGLYDIGPPSDTATHGPYVLPLYPRRGNAMFGRSGFLIHGDSKTQPGLASHGCIILPRPDRETIWESNDHEIQVIEKLPSEPIEV